MKKVLIVMSSLYNGGAERSLVNFLNELPEDKYQIDLLLFKRQGMFMKQLPEYVNVLQTPKAVEKLYGSISKSGVYFFPKMIGTLIATLLTKNPREKRAFRWKYFYGTNIEKMQEHYDVAIAYISGEILYYVDEKVNADRKIVWIHNDYKTAQHPKKYDYSHLENMDGIVSISDLCVEILKDEFPEFADKVYMLENITSSVVLKNRATEFIPEEFENSEINILSIGRLHEQKGFDLAIEAAKIMKEQGLNFKWFIIGNGELKEELEKQINALNLADYFILLGTRENPYPYIKNCSIFVQPSRYEGKSVVLDEAKILAVPIVATAYPTVGDQLQDREEGMIVPLNAEGIAEGLERMMRDAELRDRYTEYLSDREYGNQKEIEKYVQLMG
ncbi:MAG: glycosyltransferase [Lachnospiraceae bacterium]|nr:glycosyltransferase [Lachnospiraceae bacterium]